MPNVVDIVLRLQAQQTQELERLRRDMREFAREQDAARRQVVEAARAQREAREATTQYGLSLRNVIVAGAAFAGVNLSVRGLAAVFRTTLTRAVELADQFQNLATRLGGTFEGVQTLTNLAREFGLESDAFTSAIDRMNRRLAEAKDGSTEAAAPFHALGLTLADFEGLTAERKLELIGRAMLSATDDNQAFLAAVEILGREAVPQLQAALEELGRGFDRLSERQRAAGQILSEETGRRLAEAKRSIEEISTQLTLLGGAAARNLLGAADATGKFLADLEQPDRGARAVTIEAVRSIRTRTNAIGSAEDRERVREQLRREAEELRALIAAEDLAELDRTAPQSPNQRARLEGLREVLHEYEESLRILDNELLARVLISLTEQEREAAKLADAAKQRAINEERAAIWLGANAEKYEQQNRALREALLADEERLTLLQERLATLDAAASAALSAAGSEAERRKIALQSEHERLTLTRDIAQLGERVAANQERIAREAERAAEKQRQAARDEFDFQIRRLELVVRASQFEREMLQLRTDASAPAVQEKVAAATERERDALRQIIQLRRDSLQGATPQEGIAIEEDLQRDDERLAKSGLDPQDVRKATEEAQILDRAVQGVSHAIAQTAVEGEDLGETLKGVFRRIAADILEATIRAQIFGRILGAAGAGGGAGGIGGAIASFLGNLFAEGGYTGRGAKYEVAGVVHRGEYVIPKAVVDRTGPGVWASAVQRVRGYADGGYVGLIPDNRDLFTGLTPAISDPGSASPIPGDFEPTFMDPGAASTVGRIASTTLNKTDNQSSVIVTNNFESGLARVQLAQLMPEMENRILAAVGEAIRRGRIL